jgi:hypothetical protein
MHITTNARERQKDRTEPPPPHGHMPGCRLYSANLRDNAALEWALGQDCTTAFSQSHHRHLGPTSLSLLRSAAYSIERNTPATIRDCMDCPKISWDMKRP